MQFITTTGTDEKGNYHEIGITGMVKIPAGNPQGGFGYLCGSKRFAMRIRPVNPFDESDDETPFEEMKKKVMETLTKEIEKWKLAYKKKYSNAVFEFK